MFNTFIIDGADRGLYEKTFRRGPLKVLLGGDYLNVIGKRC